MYEVERVLVLLSQKGEKYMGWRNFVAPSRNEADAGFERVRVVLLFASCCY